MDIKNSLLNLYQDIVSLDIITIIVSSDDEIIYKELPTIRHVLLSIGNLYKNRLRNIIVEESLNNQILAGMEIKISNDQDIFDINDFINPAKFIKKIRDAKKNTNSFELKSKLSKELQEQINKYKDEENLSEILFEFFIKELNNIAKIEKKFNRAFLESHYPDEIKQDKNEFENLFRCYNNINSKDKITFNLNDSNIDEKVEKNLGSDLSFLWYKYMAKSLQKILKRNNNYNKYKHDLERINIACSQIIGIFKALKKRGSNDRNQYGYEEIEVGIDTLPFNWNEIITIRKIWERGLDKISMLSCINISGDITTHITSQISELEDSKKNLFIKMHMNAIETSIRTWQNLIDFTRDSFVKIFLK